MALCTKTITIDIEESLYWKCVIEAAKHHQDVNEWMNSVFEDLIEDAESFTRNN